MAANEVSSDDNFGQIARQKTRQVNSSQVKPSQVELSRAAAEEQQLPIISWRSAEHEAEEAPPFPPFTVANHSCKITTENKLNKTQRPVSMTISDWRPFCLLLLLLHLLLLLLLTQLDPSVAHLLTSPWSLFPSGRSFCSYVEHAALP